MRVVAVDASGAGEIDSEPSTHTEYRPNLIRRLYDWCLSWADSKFGTPALFLMSFAESSFFPIPPDILQIALSVAKPRRAFFYAAVSAVASVMGAVLGWAIGVWFWEANKDFFFHYLYLFGFTEENFHKVEVRYNEYAFWSILISAISPIPYKIFTIASGVFGVSLTTLLIASAIGRSSRFFLVAGLIHLFGPKVKELIEKYFNLATILFAALLIGGMLVIKYLL